MTWCMCDIIIIITCHSLFRAKSLWKEGEFIWVCGNFGTFRLGHEAAHSRTRPILFTISLFLRNFSPLKCSNGTSEPRDKKSIETCKTRKEKNGKLLPRPKKPSTKSSFFFSALGRCKRIVSEGMSITKSRTNFTHREP